MVTPLKRRILIGYQRERCVEGSGPRELFRQPERSVVDNQIQILRGSVHVPNHVGVEDTQDPFRPPVGFVSVVLTPVKAPLLRREENEAEGDIVRMPGENPGGLKDRRRPGGVIVGSGSPLEGFAGGGVVVRRQQESILCQVSSPMEGDDVPPPITELAEGKLFEGDLQPVGSEPFGEIICGLIAGGRRRIAGGKRLQRLYRLLEILPGDLLDNPAQEVAFPVWVEGIRSRRALCFLERLGKETAEFDWRGARTLQRALRRPNQRDPIAERGDDPL